MEKWANLNGFTTTNNRRMGRIYRVATRNNEKMGKIDGGAIAKELCIILFSLCQGALAK